MPAFAFPGTSSRARLATFCDKSETGTTFFCANFWLTLVMIANLCFLFSRADAFLTFVGLVSKDAKRYVRF